MKTNQLQALVQKAMKNNWKGSGIPEDWQKNIETITKHLSQCESCSFDFENFSDSDETLNQTFNDFHKPENLKDWICE